jgi:uncharacterized metal-binding protein
MISTHIPKYEENKMVRCTDCHVWACRTAEHDKLPTEGFCPMRIHEEALAKAREKYNDPTTRKFSQTAAKIEAAGYCEWSRLEETIEFARSLGVHKIGIAFCLGLRREAAVLARIYSENGFEVSSVGCKCGSIPKEEIGLKDEDKLHPGELEILCNPVGQAEVLNAEETGLNVIVGLCVGHDSLFIKNSKAFVTCLIAKDRVLVHNPVGAIYAHQSYYQSKLYEKHKLDNQD